METDDGFKDHTKLFQMRCTKGKQTLLMKKTGWTRQERNEEDQRGMTRPGDNYIKPHERNISRNHKFTRRI